MAPATKQICLGDAAYDLNKNIIHLMTVTGHCGGGGDESEDILLLQSQVPDSSVSVSVRCCPRDSVALTNPDSPLSTVYSRSTRHCTALSPA